MKVLVMLVLCSMVFAGCEKEKTKDDNAGSIDRKLSIPETPAVGVLSGEAFSVLSGIAQKDHFSEGGMMIQLWKTTSFVNPCYAMEVQDQKIMLFVPAKTGAYSLGTDNLGANFYDYAGGENINTVALIGKIEISEINGGVVKGGLVAFANDSNKVQGTFEVANCLDL